MKKFLLRALVVQIWTLLAVVSAHAQIGSHHIDIAVTNIDGTVAPVSFAQIRVCVPTAVNTPCTPQASIYSDVNLTVPLSQPITADANGNFDFYALPGFYQIQISSLHIPTVTQNWVVLPQVGGNLSNVTFQTNGVNNFSQSILNLVSTSTVTVANVSGGNVTFTVTGPGTGTVTNFFAGNLPPLFTTSVATPQTTPTLSFALTNATGGTVFGNSSGTSGAPSYTPTPVLGVPGTTLGSLGLAGNVSGTVTIEAQPTGSTWTFKWPTNAGTPGYVLSTDGTGVGSWIPIPAVTFQTNGVNNTSQSLLNLVAGTNITITNISGGNVQISSTGGSGNCPPGTIPDLSVLSVHPLSTCFGNGDWIWDDANEIMAAGNPLLSGGVSFTGSHANYQETYAFGGATFNLATQGVGGFFVAGSNHTITGNLGATGMGDIFMIGRRLTAKNTNDEELLLGFGSSIADDAGGNTVLGGGSISSTVPGTPADVSSSTVDCGEITAAPTSPVHYEFSDIHIVCGGFNSTNTVTSNSNQIFIFGYNSANSTGDGMTDILLAGVDNTLEDSNAADGDVAEVGFGNDVNGAPSTVQIFGYENEVIGISKGSVDNNTVIAGTRNTATNLDNDSGTFFSAIFGQLITLENCDDCIAVGSNFTDNGDTNAMDVGFGAIQLRFNSSGVTCLVTCTGFSALLKTNGTTNSTQTVLNLAAGSNISISESAGTVTISGTGGGGGTTPGGSPGQTQYNSAGAFGGYTPSGGYTINPATGVATLGNPGPSTLGGIESITCASHMWINQISTSGVPSCTQPAFTDISGTLAVSQGGSGAATFTVHGVLLGEGTSAFGVTTAGTLGQCFLSNGPTTDPSFQSCPGGTPAFSVIASGTNTTAAMLVGTGASLEPTGSGIIEATAFAVSPSQCAANQASSGIAANGNANCFNIFYQTIDNNGTPVTQRLALNFSTMFAFIDSPSPSRTSIDLSGVDVIHGGTGFLTALQNAILFGNGTSPIGTLTPPSDSQNYFVMQDGNNPPNLALAGVSTRVVTGTSDTIASGDRGGGVWITSVANDAETVPTAGGTGFGSNWISNIFVSGAGTATFTPVSGTINGVSSWPVPQGNHCGLFSPDNANWLMPCSPGILSAGAGIVLTPSPWGNQISANGYPGFVSASALTLSSTVYLPVGGGGVSSTTETNVDIESPTAQPISHLYVQLSAAPGAGNSVTITLRDGAVSKTVTCTVSGASATTCNDATHSFTPAVGDLLDWQISVSGTIVATPNLMIGYRWGQ